MSFCKKCRNKVMLMSGEIYLIPDDEPYESSKFEPSKTGIKEINDRIIAHYCENCEEVVETFNE